jgi:Tol biopolymer transport system component
VIRSTRPDLNAQLSPDGTRVVFESNRSGTHEVWVADRNGGNAFQLTSLGGRIGGRQRGPQTDSPSPSISATRMDEQIST